MDGFYGQAAVSLNMTFTPHNLIVILYTSILEAVNEIFKYTHFSIIPILGFFNLVKFYPISADGNTCLFTLGRIHWNRSIYEILPFTKVTTCRSFLIQNIVTLCSLLTRKQVVGYRNSLFTYLHNYRRWYGIEYVNESTSSN